MKKFFLMLAIASLSMNAMAQEPTEKYSVATNSFWSNWFIQTNVTWNTFYQGGNNTILSTPFYKFPLGSESWKDGADFKHPTSPGLGLRLKANTMWTQKAFKGYKASDKQDCMYTAFNGQVLFNLSNMICGYDENRVWNFVPYLGAGLARNWSAHHNGVVLSAGLMNTFRISRVVALNLELGYLNYDKAVFSGKNKSVCTLPRRLCPRCNKFNVGL